MINNNTKRKTQMKGTLIGKETSIKEWLMK